jgi:hypothetical protein
VLIVLVVFDFKKSLVVTYKDEKRLVVVINYYSILLSLKSSPHFLLEFEKGFSPVWVFTGEGTVLHLIIKSSFFSFVFYNIFYTLSRNMWLRLPCRDTWDRSIKMVVALTNIMRSSATFSSSNLVNFTFFNI